MSVRVSTATGSFDSASVVGLTVDDVRGDDSFADLLGLQGGEVADVQRAGGDWTSANGDYVLRDGDALRFTKAAGDKG